MIRAPLTVADAVFGKVSVVMMARAKRSGVPAFALSTRAGMDELIFPTGKGRPITPVDATNISWSEQPIAFAKRSAQLRAAANPSLPIAALAFPELTRTARTRPPERFK